MDDTRDRPTPDVPPDATTRPGSEDVPDRKVAAPLGAVGGAVAAGTAGTLVLGPIGTIIGAIVGAVGGGWLGIAGSRAAEYTDEHDQWYRQHYERSPGRLADRGYEAVRPAYQLGYYASLNPDYRGRDFDSIETDLRRGWTDDVGAAHGRWDVVRDYARAAYERVAPERQGTTRLDLDLGGTETHRRASFSDPLPDLIDPVNSSTGQSVSGDVSARETGEVGWMKRIDEQTR